LALGAAAVAERDRQRWLAGFLIADSVYVQRPGRRMAGTFRSPWSARPYASFRFSRRWLI